MATAASRTNRIIPRLPIPQEKGDEIVGFLLAALVVLLLGSLSSYHPLDPSWLHSEALDESRQVRNFVGPFGAQIAAVFFALLGLTSFLLPVVLGLESWRRLVHKEKDQVTGRNVGLVAAMLVSPAFVHLLLEEVVWRGEKIASGGALGAAVSGFLSEHFNAGGAFVVLMTVMLVGGSLAANTTLGEILVNWRQGLRGLWQRVVLARAQYDKRHKDRSMKRRVLQRHVKKQREEQERRDAAVASTSVPRTPRISQSIPIAAAVGIEPLEKAETQPEAKLDLPLRVTEKKGKREFGLRKVTAAARSGAESPACNLQPVAAEPEPELDRQENISFRPEELLPTELPPVNLLSTERPEQHHDETELVRRGELIRENAEHFGVQGKIAAIGPGPVITVFEFQPAPGVKVSKVVNLQDDLALALRADSVRIDRIPGRSTMGMEVPNKQRSIIHLGQLLANERFKKAKSPLTMALGVDIHGEPVYFDLATMPHLLVAGATGAGKSVALQSMITSILYKATRDDVQFIFIDPKRVELGVYGDIPHLKTEVVVEPKKAANALRWAVSEMERRYRLLAEVHVRSIDYYNRAIRDPAERARLSLKEGESEFKPEDFKPLPYYVIIIDELADLMMVSSSEVEASIARLAQMARAVGIHLIIATQRPSVDVLTGTIKANFPCRLAFATATRHDSRTILDQVGSERLLGKGDALFMPPGTSRIMRLHGAYISEEETASLIRWLKRRGKPELDLDVIKDQEESSVSKAQATGSDGDTLFDEAARLVVAERQASASFLQRRMRVGFSRAARLVDLLEADGLLGPAQGSKPRDVLVPVDYFDEVDRVKSAVE